MATPYIIATQLNLTAPVQQIRKIRQQIQTGLSDISIGINPRINRQMGNLAASMDKVVKSGGSMNQVFASMPNNVNRVRAQVLSLSDAMGKGADSQKVLNQLSDIWTGKSNGNSKALKNLNTQTKTTTQSLRRHTDSVGTLVGAYGRMAVGSAAVFGSLRQLNQVLQTNITLLKSATNLAQIYGQSVSSQKVQGVLNQIRQSGAARGSSLTDVSGAVGLLEQSGLKTNSSTIDTLSKLNVNKQVTDLKAIASQMVILQNAWGLKAGKDQEQYFQMLLKASKDTSAEVDGLVGAASQIGPAFKSVGTSASFMLAALSKVKDISGASSSSIALQYQQIVNRLRSAPETESALKSLGIDIYELRNGRKEFRDLADILTDANSLIQEFGDRSQQAGTLYRAIGGGRRTAVTIGLIGNIKAIKAYADELKGFSGDIISKDAQIFADTFLGKLQKIGNQFVNLGQQIANSTIFKAATSSLLLMAKAIASVGSSLSEIIPLLGLVALTKVPAIGKAIGGIKSGVAGKYTGARTAFDNRTKRVPAGNVDFNKLNKAYLAEIKVRNQGISSIRAEDYARKSAQIAINKGTKVWVNSAGKITTSTSRFVSRMGKQLAGAVAGKGLLLTGLAAGAVGAFGGESVQAEAATTGLTTSFGLLALGASGVTAGFAGALFAVKSYSDGLIEERRKLKSQSISDAIQDLVGASRIPVTDPAGAQARISGGSRLIKELKAQRDLVGVDEIRNNIKSEEVQGALVLWRGFKKVFADIDAVAETAKTKQQAYDAEVEKSADALNEMRAGLLQTYKTMEQFRNSIAGKEYLQFTRELERATGIETGTNERLLAEEYAKREAAQPASIITRKGSPFDYINRLKFGRGSLEDLGSSEYNRQTSRVPGIGRDAFDIGRASRILAPTLKNVIGSGVNRDEIGKYTRQSLQVQGLPDNVINPIITSLENLKDTLDFEDLNDASKKVFEDALGKHAEAVVRTTEEYNNSLQPLRDFSSGLRDSVNSQTQLGNRVSQGQLGIERQRRDFLGLGAQAGLGNAFIQSRATELGGSSDTRVLGSNLKKFNEQLAIATKNQDEVVGDAIRTKIDKTKSALELLANTGERTSDSLRKIQEQQRDQETRGRFARRVFGSDMAGRMDALRGMSEVSMVQQQGLTWDQLTPDMVNRVVSTLESLGSTAVAGTGGLSGDELLRMIDARTLGEDYIADDTKTLQKQVIQTQLDSINATRELLGAEQNLQQQFFNNLSTENQKFLMGLGAVIGEPKKMAAGGFVGGFGFIDKIKALLTPGEYVMSTKDVAEMEKAMRQTQADRGAAAMAKYSPEKMAEQRDMRVAKSLMSLRGPAPETGLTDFGMAIVSNEYKGDVIGEEMAQKQKARRDAITKKYGDMKPGSLGVSSPNRSSLNFFDRQLAQRKASRIASGGGGEGIIDKGLRLASSSLQKMNAPESPAYKKSGDHLSGSYSAPTPAGGGAPTAPMAGTVAPVTIDPTSLDALSTFNKGLMDAGAMLSGVADKFMGLTVEHSISHRPLEIIINGANVLQNIMPEIRQYVEIAIKQQLNNFIKMKVPDLGTID